MCFILFRVVNLLPLQALDVLWHIYYYIIITLIIVLKGIIIIIIIIFIFMQVIHNYIPEKNSYAAYNAGAALYLQSVVHKILFSTWLVLYYKC